ncbi:MAG: glycosyltransferase family 2 protein, partial [Ekhidna sp.]|nr:glycosyltransferase family 2 protein [Ekhidna sp.]
MEALLIISFIILLYTYVGYGIVMTVLNRRRKKKTHPVKIQSDEALPMVSVLIPAYNEVD